MLWTTLISFIVCLLDNVGNEENVKFFKEYMLSGVTKHSEFLKHYFTGSEIATTNFENIK